MLYESMFYMADVITITYTPWCVYKIMNLNIFSDLRKPGLVPGKSLSPSTKFDSVLEKNKFYIKLRTF